MTQPTVLIVDPCSMTRQCMSALLRAKKLQTITAQTIEEAVHICDSHEPELILHEMNFPDGAFDELIARIRERSTGDGPSFFLLTDITHQSRLLGAIEQGIVQIMIKPQFTIKVFYAKIENLLRGRRAKRSLQVLPRHNAPPAEEKTRGKSTALPSEQRTEPRPQLRTREQKQELYKSIKPVLTRAEAIERAEVQSELKALSPTAARVLSLTNSAEASLESIASAIRNDHAIALKVIRVANSTAFSRGEPVTTLNDAVLRIGVQQIRQTVLNIEIMENFSQNTGDLIDPRLFWEHSIAVGMTCAMISRETREMDPDEAFTVGLLHDVGRMILSQAYGDQYTDAAAFARENQFPLELVERRMFLLDHASIMSNVLHKWGLSSNLIDPIVNHHLSVGNIRQTCPKRLTTVATVALADRMVHAMRLGCSGNQTLYPTEDYFEALRLPQGFIRVMESKLPEMVLDMRIAMLGDMGVSDYPSPRRVCSSGIVRPIYLTQDPDKDGIRLWVQSLQECEDELDPPNFAVVRLRNAREAVGIDSRLRGLEAELGISQLPCVVISNAGNLELPASTQSPRQTRLLPAPFTSEEFEQAVMMLPGMTGAPEDKPKAA